MKAKVRYIRKIIDRLNRKREEWMKREIRVAFIGCGKHANENLYPSLEYANMHLVAVCARHLENAKRQALLFGAQGAYDDYHLMLEKEQIDGLLVCVNEEMHYQAAREALSRGIPVFVEKPPCASLKEAKELCDLSRQKDLYLMVGFNKRFGPVYQEAKNIIKKGGVGSLNSVSIRAFVGETLNEKRLLLDVGIHYADLLRFFGGEVRNIQVKKKIRGNKATIVMSCELEGGALGTLQLSNNFSWAKPGEYIEILGEESMLILDNSHEIIHHKATISLPGEVNIDGEKSTVWTPNYSVPSKENHLIFLNGYVPELRNFADSLNKGYDGLSNIQDGAQALGIIEGISTAR